jgi:hypothetical protein
MSITLGQNASPDDFISTSAGAADVGKVPKLNAAGQLDQSFLKKPIRRTYKYGATVGSSTTRFDITRPGTPNANTTRYTWDGVGTDPVINSSTFPVGSRVWIKHNGAIGNQGEHVVTAVGADWFEVTNASGSAQNDITLSSNGFLRVFKDITWTKPTGLSHIEVEVQGGGGGAQGSDSTTGTDLTAGGGSGGYAKELIVASSLSSTETVQVGSGGIGTDSSGTPDAAPDAAKAGGTSAFGSHVSAAGGSPSSANQGGAGGAASGGDINIDGGRSESIAGSSGQPGKGADSVLGRGGVNLSNTPQPASGYGAGGAGAADNNRGGEGGEGIVIVTEYY